MAVETENLITVREAAKECQRTTETVRRWIWDGKLPARKLGNQLFVRKADLALLGHGSAGPDRAARLAALEEARAIRESIRQRIGGNLDILQDLDQSRESHP